MKPRNSVMTAIADLPELMLRSADATWDRARWEQLPDDGNRYEVIDGVLYMTTAPSFFTSVDHSPDLSCALLRNRSTWCGSNDLVANRRFHAPRNIGLCDRRAEM